MWTLEWTTRQSIDSATTSAEFYELMSLGVNSDSFTSFVFQTNSFVSNFLYVWKDVFLPATWINKRKKETGSSFQLEQEANPPPRVQKPSEKAHTTAGILKNTIIASKSFLRVLISSDFKATLLLIDRKSQLQQLPASRFRWVYIKEKPVPEKSRNKN